MIHRASCRRCRGCGGDGRRWWSVSWSGLRNRTGGYTYRVLRPERPILGRRRGISQNLHSCVYFFGIMLNDSGLMMSLCLSSLLLSLSLS